MSLYYVFCVRYLEHPLFVRLVIQQERMPSDIALIDRWRRWDVRAHGSNPFVPDDVASVRFVPAKQAS